MAIAAYFNLEAKQFDVINAFPNAKLPPGYSVPFTSLPTSLVRTTIPDYEKARLETGPRVRLSVY